ncbi:8996_t:CDS:1, partial [Paraglomus occultum]
MATRKIPTVCDPVNMDHLKTILTYLQPPKRTVTVTALYIYPVKGCRGIAVTSRRTNENGF